MSLGPKLRRFAPWVPPAFLAGVYLVSLFHVAHVTLTQSDRPILGRQIIRVAHSMVEPRTQAAFRRLADEYEALNPEVRILIQSIPERAYRQWITTQLMGETAPDLVQIVGTTGIWAALAQDHFLSLTALINEPNPYNRGTGLEGRLWRETFLDGMESGYFMHLMDFYGVPLTIESTRIFYNKDLFEAATGSDRPPENFSDWMRICRDIHAYRERLRAADPRYTVFPIAASVEDDYLSRYVHPMTADMMDVYEPAHWGQPSPMLTLYGLFTGVFTLKHPDIRRGFELIREIAAHFQPSFLSDQSEQRRMLFVQQRAAMVTGETRDMGYYEMLCDFRVGVFDFPQVEPEHPVYGPHWRGPARERTTGAFTFALTRMSRNADRALDFLQFATSQQRNAEFCGELDWYPAVEGADLGNPALAVFQPREEGVSRFPVLFSTGATRLFVEQNMPLFLHGQIEFDEFMDGLEREWLQEFPGEIDRLIQVWIRNQHQTEYNVARSKARMLFEEAGAFEAGTLRGSRTPYQLGLEILELLDQGNTFRRYIWERMLRGEYRFPPDYEPES